MGVESLLVSKFYAFGRIVDDQFNNVELVTRKIHLSYIHLNHFNL